MSDNMLCGICKCKYRNCFLEGLVPQIWVGITRFSPVSQTEPKPVAVPYPLPQRPEYVPRAVREKAVRNGSGNPPSPPSCAARGGGDRVGQSAI